MSNSVILKNLPFYEQPRERLALSSSSEALSSAELLAILLGSGMRGKTALQLAHELLLQFEGLTHLAEASVEELTRVKGIGKTKAVVLKAAFGLARRVHKDEQIKDPLITHPGQVYQRFRHTLAEEKRETLICLLLNTKKKLIREVRISQGTLTQTLIHPREVFHPAIKYHAQAIILVHNHPSGDPTPSNEDISITREITKIGELLNIPLIDHVIVAREGYRSLLSSQK